MQSEPVMIDDPRVLEVEIIDCGESLVDVRTLGLRTAEDHPRATSPAETRFWCRESVADKLVAVNDRLGQVDLVVTEAHRPLDLQRVYWEADLASVVAARPELTRDQAAVETAKYVAPPWIVPPHTTGGAVDVILMRGEHELPMGCELNEQCEAMRTAYEHLDGEHRANRDALVDAMQNDGFVNYGHEWWHFSFGDRYWAYATASTAIYGAL